MIKYILFSELRRFIVDINQIKSLLLSPLVNVFLKKCQLLGKRIEEKLHALLFEVLDS